MLESGGSGAPDEGLRVLTRIVPAGAMTAVDAWQWHPRPDVWLTVIALYGGYWYALSAWAPTHGDRPPATARERRCFTVAVALLLAATDGPIDTIGETYLFSVHMVQFLLLTLVVPPLLLLGTPPWLLRRLLIPRMAARVANALTRPMAAAILFNAVILLSHWPAVVELYLRSDPVHFLVHVAWVGSALVWWWPVLSPLRERPHLPAPGGMLYLFTQSFLPTIPASFLTFGRQPLYDFYARAPRLWGLSAVADQQIAGLLMKIGGGLLLWTAIAALFFRWSYEDRTAAADWLYQRDDAMAARSTGQSLGEPGNPSGN